MRQLAAAAWKFSTLFFLAKGILAKTKNCNRVINILTAPIGEQQNYAKNNKRI